MAAPSEKKKVDVYARFLPELIIENVSDGKFADAAGLEQFNCAVMFADISGFTPLAESFAAWVDVVKGTYKNGLGFLAESEQQYDVALAPAEDNGDESLRATILTARAKMLLMAGRYEDAMSGFEILYPAAIVQNSPQAICWSLLGRARSYSMIFLSGYPFCTIKWACMTTFLVMYLAPQSTGKKREMRALCLICLILWSPASRPCSELIRERWRAIKLRTIRHCKKWA
ncbi:MAG: hypothetical protein ACI9W1_000045 [Candidatus Azotimanducaceae bacterium]|jgi:hypothetical protein